MNLFEYLKHIDNDSHELKELLSTINSQLPYAFFLNCKDSLIYIDSDIQVEGEYNVMFSPLSGDIGSRVATTLTIDSLINSCDITILYDNTKINFIEGSGGFGNARFNNEVSETPQFSTLTINDFHDNPENEAGSYQLYFEILSDSEYSFGISEILLQDSEGNEVEARSNTCDVVIPDHAGVK